MGGLFVLIWSSDRFVDGSAGLARIFGISPLVIGMVIVGFGTSAPELVVSAFSAVDGKPALALGNAYGSNIANVAFILGTTALILPIQVSSKLLRRELPLLCGVTLFSFILLRDLALSRTDGLLMIVVFLLSMGWTVWIACKRPDDDLLKEMRNELPEQPGTTGKAVFNLVLGLVLLMVSSRVLVLGAVKLAELANVSELIIGLTVVAIGTSLPELASTLAAVRKGEHDLAMGNVVGSNMFNTLAVVGVASSIHPFSLETGILERDFRVMSLLTLSLFLVGWGRKGSGRINRWEGGLLLAVFLGYTSWLVVQVLQSR